MAKREVEKHLQWRVGMMGMNSTLGIYIYILLNFFSLIVICRQTDPAAGVIPRALHHIFSELGDEGVNF